ncbi:endonuclease/exonuclease/phosphatase family protein [Ancylostoma duodenale]|uniref:Endonuclease/exonuclease/phosphatase family protein n=1 Tax=Ancylostoma duodenale TaxID=51022 RepID=A0A0C2DAD7_9BILA|nr:endonuclease/exonuclease/phosphatase family protein [Ancylostoma duodenale]
MTFATERKPARNRACSLTVPGKAPAEDGKGPRRGATRDTEKRFGQSLDISTYNCRSAASDAELRTLLHLAKKIRYDVVRLQETKTKASYAGRMENEELLLMGQKIDAKNIEGVGFLIHPKIQPSILSHDKSTFAVLRLRTENKATIIIVNSYAPNSIASEEDKDNFYTELEAVVRKEKSYYKHICGDFNALVGNGGDGNWRLGRHGNGIRNDNGFGLLDLKAMETYRWRKIENPTEDYEELVKGLIS